MKFNKYWFKPKSFGYGATPCTWEGWLIVVLFVLYIFSLAYFFIPNNMSYYYWYFGIGIVILIIISKKKTAGDWKWKWNE
ncbi:MAG: hypothetical protein ABIH82_02455 [Candidatus Woesearchaeota archaeon]